MEPVDPADPSYPTHPTYLTNMAVRQSGEWYHARRATCTSEPRASWSAAAALAPLAAISR